MTAAADVAPGSRESDHDLSALHGALCSHGGRHEQLVPHITSGTVGGPLASRFRAGIARSRDIHHLVLNHLR